MGVTITTMETIENPLEIEGDLETGEEVRGTEVGNPPIQENHQDRDRDLTADIVGTIVDLLMRTTCKNPIDQNMEEVRGGGEARDTNPKKTEEVSMAMVAGVEKSARRP